MKKLNIALLGLGTHMLRGHYEPLVSNPEVNIIAGFDPAERINKEFDLERMSEAEIFADPSVDAVIVSSPDQFHIGALESAVESGKHALIDKPLATETKDLEKLYALLEEAKEKSLIISSCHPRRFDPPYIFFKDNIEAWRKELGEVLEIRLDFFYHSPSKTGLHTGLLGDHFNHEIDYLNFLLSFENFEAKKLFDSETRYAVSGIREDGIGFHFFGTRTLNSRTYHEQIAGRFERGYVRLNTGSGDLLIEDYDRETIEHKTGPTTDYENRFYNLNNNFVQACLGKKESYLNNDELFVNSASGICLTDSGLFQISGLSE